MMYHIKSNRNLNRNLNRGRILLLVLAATLIFLQGLILTGCGGGKEGVSCADIVKGCSEIAKEGTFDVWAAYGDEVYDDSFSNMYGVQYSMIDDGAICYTEAGGVADEITILHMKDSADVSIAKEKLADRVATRRSTFAGYKPEEVSKIDDSRIIVQGNYVILLITDDNDTMETEIRRIISEG